MKPFELLTTLLAVAFAIAPTYGFRISDHPEVDYQNISAARAHYAPPGGVTSDWLKDLTARGSSYASTITVQTDWHDADTGKYLYSSIDQSSYSISTSGTVIALPVGGWNVVEEFTYYGNGYKVAKGKLVTVKVKICAPNTTKMPTNAQCEKTVRNLAESGMSIPKSAGKGGHIRPLKRLAMQRFGASNVDVIYKGCEDAQLKFLLFNCDEKKEDANVRTMMFDGEKPRKGASNPVEEDHGSLENFGRDREPNSHKEMRRRIDRLNGVSY